MDKILSVSIAAYNAAYCVSKCIDSFIKSKYIDDIELLVVDDGSTDNIKEVMAPYLENYANSIRLISKKNGGHGSTINTSIVNCTGKYYKIVDADDWVETDNLDKLIEYLKISDVDLVLNPYYKVNPQNEKKLNVALSTNMDFHSKRMEDISKDVFLAMHSMTIKSDVVKKVGPIIDENCFYVDTEYVVFSIEYINTVSSFSYPIYDYLVGTSNQSMNKANLEKRRNQQLRVVERLIEFFNRTENTVSEEKRYLLKKEVLCSICAHYIILLGIDAKKIVSEMKEYDAWVKKQSLELYRDTIGYGEEIHSGYIKLIGIFRKMNFKGYVFIVNILMKLNVVK